MIRPDRNGLASAFRLGSVAFRLPACPVSFIDQGILFDETESVIQSA